MTFTEKASREIAHRKHTGRSKSLAPLCEVKVAQSCPTLWGPMVYVVHGISPGQNTGVGSLSLLQKIFPTQILNPGLPHCGQILYELNHQESPRILEWVAHPFPSGSSWPRNRTGVPCIAGRFFFFFFLASWAAREAQTELATSCTLYWQSLV